MNQFASKYSCTQKSVQPIEHTPIYDIQAYNLRQRTRKRKQLLKNLLDTTVFFSVIVFTFSMLFWGV